MKTRTVKRTNALGELIVTVFYDCPKCGEEYPHSGGYKHEMYICSKREKATRVITPDPPPIELL